MAKSEFIAEVDVHPLMISLLPINYFPTVAATFMIIFLIAAIIVTVAIVSDSC